MMAACENIWNSARINAGIFQPGISMCNHDYQLIVTIVFSIEKHFAYLLCRNRIHDSWMNCSGNEKL